MTVHSALDLRLVLASLVALLPLACGKPDAAGTQAADSTVGKSASSANVEPFAYAAPVTGHYAEINTGEFDLVDGIAFPSSAGAGTVVYVTSKAIASPVLAESNCPMSAARVIALLRDAPYLEITVDPTGKSKYFAQGTQLGGRGREEDVGGRYWEIASKSSVAGRASGSFTYRDRGSFAFDLPIAKPTFVEVSETDRMGGRRVPEGAPTPDGSAVVEVYRALHAAAKARDLATLLAAQGFSEREIGAIRGLPGIDVDFAAFADRFLDPGLPEDPTVYAGYGGVGAGGTNAKGEKFKNYYEFTPVGERLLLVGISENPQ